jgi:sporulation integral membrane protein YtvI
MDNKKLNFILNTVYVLIIIGIVFVLLKYVLGYILPFVIGFALAAMFQPLIRIIQKTTRLPNKLVAIIVIFIFFTILVMLLGWLSFEVFVFLLNFFKGLPQFYLNTILPYLENVAANISHFIKNLDPTLVSAFQEYFDTIIGSTSAIITSVSVAVVTSITSVATRVPIIIVGLLIMIIVTFFIAVDYERIVSFIKNQMNEHTKTMMQDINGYIFQLLKKYGKSYLIIMSVTFVELTIGFTILGIPNALVIAFLIAIFDILPVLGTGGVVIPWAIFLFIDGNIALGFGMLVLYVIVTIVRNVIEPRILGGQIGLHPVLTLFAMYVGVQLIGFFGLFLAPMTLAILKSLHDSGKITLYREPAQNQQHLDE